MISSRSGRSYCSSECVTSSITRILSRMRAALCALRRVILAHRRRCTIALSRIPTLRPAPIRRPITINKNMFLPLALSNIGAFRRVLSMRGGRAKIALEQCRRGNRQGRRFLPSRRGTGRAVALLPALLPVRCDLTYGSSAYHVEDPMSDRPIQRGVGSPTGFF